MNVSVKVKAAIRKNLPDTLTMLLGRFPDFVYGGESLATIPVFVFHEVDGLFEQNLSYLRENNYETLTVQEYLDCLATPRRTYGKKVVLTFDDGHISLWRQAYPLLQRYEAKAVSFICPGLVPSESASPRSEEGRRLCNWREIEIMHGSGHVDFQLHGMYHNLVFVSSCLVDFFHPHFRSHFLGKQDRAMVLDLEDCSLTNLWPYQEIPHNLYGLPIFSHLPRLATTKRFTLYPEIRKELCDFVISAGNTSFFARNGWRRELRAKLKKYSEKRWGRVISGQEYQEEVATELLQGKALIEEHLPGSQIAHLCYPWFRAAPEVLDTAFTCGFTTAFLGSDAHLLRNATPGGSRLIQRLSEKYIHFLPGVRRKRLLPRFIG